MSTSTKCKNKKLIFDTVSGGVDQSDQSSVDDESLARPLRSTTSSPSPSTLSLSSTVQHYIANDIVIGGDVNVGADDERTQSPATATKVTSSSNVPANVAISSINSIRFSTSKKLSSSSSLADDHVQPAKDGSQNANDRSSVSSDYQECFVEPQPRACDLTQMQGAGVVEKGASPPDGSGGVRRRNGAGSRGSSGDGAVSVTSSSGKSKSSSDRKKKGSWYNVLSPTYKSKSDDFRRIFKDVPHDERLVVDYSCALQKDILVQGRVYITQKRMCFYANIFRWETILTVNYTDIVSVTKERTARVIPNAIQVCTKDDKYFLTSFGTRDKTFLMLFRFWQNALLPQTMSAEELWQWVHHSYGEDLGLTTSDDDYVSPSHEDEVQFQEKLQQDETSSPENHKELPDEPQYMAASDLAVNRPRGSSSPAEGSMPPSPLSPGRPARGVKEAAGRGSPGPGSPIAADTPGQQAAAVPVTRPTSLGATLQVPGQKAGSADTMTDNGDTTEDDEEVLCQGHEHKSIDSLNEEFFITIDRLFELIFTDSSMFLEFMVNRKTSDLVLNGWSDADENGNRTRNLNYTLALGYIPGAKTSNSEERQVCYAESCPGCMYLVDVEFVNGGIPYGDSFTVTNRYCLTRVSGTKSRLRVSSEINFKKKLWGPVRNFIDRNATAGIIQNFTMLSEHLQRESARQLALNAAQQTGGRKRVLRRKRVAGERAPAVKRTTSAIPASDVFLNKPAPSPAVKREPSSEEWTVKVNVDVVTRIVCAVLILLVLFNALLFCKLRTLEDMAALDSYASANIFSDKSYPQSTDEWTSLLERQQRLHEAEITRWQQVISTTIKLLDHTRQTLSDLHDSVTHRRTAASGAL